MIEKRQNSCLAQQVHQDKNIDNDEKLLVQFHHPGPNEEVIDRFINYRMKVDGIKCSEFSRIIQSMRLDLKLRTRMKMIESMDC